MEIGSILFQDTNLINRLIEFYDNILCIWCRGNVHAWNIKDPALGPDQILFLLLVEKFRHQSFAYCTLCYAILIVTAWVFTCNFSFFFNFLYTWGRFLSSKEIFMLFFFSALQENVFNHFKLYMN